MTVKLIDKNIKILQKSIFQITRCLYRNTFGFDEEKVNKELWKVIDNIGKVCDFLDDIKDELRKPHE